MKVDWGINPTRMRVGLIILLTGVILQVYLITHAGSVNFYVSLLAGLYTGFGLGVVLHQVHETRRVRRATRKWRTWIDEHPGEDPFDADNVGYEERRAIARARELDLRRLRDEQRRRQPVNEDAPEWERYAGSLKPPQGGERGDGEKGEGDAGSG